MSGYVFSEDQEELFDYDLYFGSSESQYIDPADLQLQAPEANQDPQPIAPDLRPSELTSMVDAQRDALAYIENDSVHENATGHVATPSRRPRFADPIQDATRAQQNYAIGTTAAENPNSNAIASASNSVKEAVSHTRPGRSVTKKVRRCEIDGCDYTGTFTRNHELKRHVRSKHLGARNLTCGALGCFKPGSLRGTFVRLDKLTDHIRAVHAHDTVFPECPVQHCQFGAHPLDALGVHVARKHPFNKDEARSIAHATNAENRRCPLPGCKNKLFSLGSFLVHLAAHEVEDVYAFRLSASFEGLKFDFVADREASNVTIVSVSISVSCPVCTHLSLSFEDFKMHFWVGHLFRDAMRGVEHFYAWQNAIGVFASALPWDGNERTLPYSRSISCPECAHTVKGELHWSTITYQHPGLLMPEEQVISELSPFRMQILRLYPDFST